MCLHLDMCIPLLGTCLSRMVFLNDATPQGVPLQTPCSSLCCSDNVVTGRPWADAKKPASLLSANLLIYLPELHLSDCGAKTLFAGDSSYQWTNPNYILGPFLVIPYKTEMGASTQAPARYCELTLMYHFVQPHTSPGP